MGKSGAALRAAKAAQTTYTFTRAQLEDHDRQIILAHTERIEQKFIAKAKEYDEEQKQKIDAYIDEEWAKREELFRNNHDGLMNTLSLLACTASRVLIEKFHWKPIPKDGYYDRRNQTVRFADLLVQEINKICEDENADIRRYCDETYSCTGCGSPQRKKKTRKQIEWRKRMIVAMVKRWTPAKMTPPLL